MVETKPNAYFKFVIGATSTRGAWVQMYGLCNGWVWGARFLVVPFFFFGLPQVEGANLFLPEAHFAQKQVIDTLPPSQERPPLSFDPETGLPIEDADIPSDSIQPPTFQGTYTDYRISKDSLDAEVDYSSYDSMNVYFDKQEIHLYGEASVKYLDIELTADHIILNYGTNLVWAGPRTDSTGQLSGFPSFKDGTQDLTSDSLRYNFRTQKGIVYSAVTTQDDVIVRGGRSKFIQDAYQVNDTTTADVIYSEGGIFTTCTHKNPHFGIRCSRAKVVPGRLAVIGASNLEIMGVPTPLWLPFGFFPLKSGRSTGLLFPNDFEFSPQWGLGLRDVGWFFPIGEHFNFSVLTDFYVGGRYGVGVAGRYRKRYAYNGNFNVRYDVLPFENTETGEVNRRNTFIFALNHQQDQAAHPTARFGGSINFQTAQAQNLIFNDTRVQQNTTRSNFNFTKTITGAIPGTFTAGLSHDQNNQRREINVDFPNINFQTQTIYPFRDNQGQEKWYEKFQFRYTGEARASFSGSDTTFFSQQTWDEAEYGIQQRINGGIAFPVAQFFTVTPNFSYREVTYGRRLQRDFIMDPESIFVDTLINQNGEIVLDTTDFGTILDIMRPDISGFRTFNASLRVETQAFGTIRFGDKFPIRGIRHVIKPSISLAYQPGYRDNERYFDTFQDTTDLSREITYSPFDGQIFGAPPNTEQQLGINYALVNLFEAKVWSKKDSTERLVKLFNNLNVRGTYNFQADTENGEFAWSPVQVSGNTRFFKGVTSLNLSATFDPYIRVSNGGTGRGTRINTFAFDDRGDFLLLDNFTANFSTNMTVAKIRQLFQGAEEELVTDVQEEEERRFEEENALFEETDLLSLFENFSIRHNFRFSFERFADRSGGTNDTLRFNNTINSLELRGSFQLSENWQVNIGSIGYDFVSERITYPFLNLRRDLHCWEMSFSWAPVRNTFMFNIAVKPGTFDFIKVPYRRNQADGGNLFGT